MSIKDYFRDNLIYLGAAAAVIIFTAFFTGAAGLTRDAVILITLLLTVVFLFWFFGDYRKRKTYYNDFLKTFENLDNKLLIAEITEPGSFCDSEIYYAVLKRALKAMNDAVSANNRKLKEYKEYIDGWVHEIKTPIAAIKLALENNPSELSRTVSGDIDKIEASVKNALFYAKSSIVEKDYLIRKTTLAELVKSALKENSRLIIGKRIMVELYDLDYILYTDPKWIVFILGQIISNAVKYSRDVEPIIKFTGGKSDQNVILKISDNGIGIKSSDLPRVFDAGFTGETGRKHSASTGLGLYMVKKLCAKLGIDIYAHSSDMTEFTLVFPKTDHYLI